MARMSSAELAAFLRQAADEVARDASFEGTIQWEPEPMENNRWERYEVHAFVRNGNDVGQGGAWFLQGAPETRGGET